MKKETTLRQFLNLINEDFTKIRIYHFEENFKSKIDLEMPYKDLKELFPNNINKKDLEMLINFYPKNENILRHLADLLDKIVNYFYIDLKMNESTLQIVIWY